MSFRNKIRSGKAALALAGAVVAVVALAGAAYAATSTGSRGSAVGQPPP